MKRNDRRMETGRSGEQLAAQHLEAAGYHILERNWRCRSGEIDIIAELDGETVFVEVRTRTQAGSYGTASESVTPLKQRKVRTAAQLYLLQCGKEEQSIRFDVICITMPRNGDTALLDHLCGVF